MGDKILFIYIKRKITKKMLIRHPGSVPDQYRISTSQKKKKDSDIEGKKDSIRVDPVICGKDWNWKRFSFLTANVSSTFKNL